MGNVLVQLSQRLLVGEQPGRLLLEILTLPHQQSRSPSVSGIVALVWCRPCVKSAVVLQRLQLLLQQAL